MRQLDDAAAHRNEVMINGIFRCKNEFLQKCIDVGSNEVLMHAVTTWVVLTFSLLAGQPVCPYPD